MSARLIDEFRPPGQYDEFFIKGDPERIAFFEQYNSRFVKVSCPVCGSKGKFSFEKNRYTHLSCPHCSTFFVSPRPTDELMAEYYGKYGAPKHWTQFIHSHEDARRKLQHRPRVQKVLSLLQSAGFRRGGRALDVGAGVGVFADCLRESGFFDEVICLDISEECTEACRKIGLRAVCGSVEALEDSFHAVFMNDLIEHLVDPEKLLKDCAGVLHSGGVLVLATPNGMGFDLQVLREKNKTFCPPEHLTYFNPESISSLLRRCGFKPNSVLTPGSLDVQIVRRACEDDPTVLDGHAFIKRLMREPEEVQQSFQEFLSANGLSGHMLCMALKK